MDPALLFRLLSIIVILLVFAVVVWRISKKATLSDARTRGLASAKKHLANPILLDDYCQSDNTRREKLMIAIAKGDIDAFVWSGFVFIDSLSIRPDPMNES